MILNNNPRKNFRPLLLAYLDLSKPRIVGMVLFATFVGYFLGNAGIISYPLLCITLLGTALSCAGAAALNNYLEKDIDPKMNRTKFRPIPQGIISPASALGFGLLCVLLGSNLLAWKVNLLTGFLSLLTAFLYVLVYTPLKRVTWLNTFIGAIPGAIPPLGGWAAATGTLDLGAWILFLIMFIWQHPHFYAISWIYKEDYANGGLKMLSVVDPKAMFRQTILYLLILLPVSLLPTYIHISGQVYFYGVLLLGLVLLYLGIIFSTTHSMLAARRLFRASVIYLPMLFLLVMLDYV